MASEHLAADAVAAANEKSRRLRELLRAPELLVMPGAWDPLSAILFRHLGFQAVQGGSAAIAAKLGYPDGDAEGIRQPDGHALMRKGNERPEAPGYAARAFITN
jgi:hypothetical protein